MREATFDPREELDQTQEEMAAEERADPVTRAMLAAGPAMLNAASEQGAALVLEHADRLRMTTTVVIPAGTQIPHVPENKDCGCMLCQPGEIVETRPFPVAKPTLGSLLAMLEQLDELMEADVDPALLVGDVKDKVDGIKQALDRFEALATYLEAQAAPMIAGMKAANRNVERIKKYVQDQMELHNFEKLPGDTWRVQLQANGGRPSLVFTDGHEQPTEADQVAFHGLVQWRMVYEWNTDKVRAFLEGGEELPFARLHKGKHCRFYLNRDTKKALKSSKEITK